MGKRPYLETRFNSLFSVPIRKESEEGPCNRMLTVTSYLTLLPTSLSDRMALSPFTLPEKKSCWGVATLVVEEREEGIKRPGVQSNGVRKVRSGEAELKPRIGRGPHKQRLPGNGQRQFDEDMSPNGDRMQLLLTDPDMWA